MPLEEGMEGMSAAFVLCTYKDVVNVRLEGRRIQHTLDEWMAGVLRTRPRTHRGDDHAGASTTGSTGTVASGAKGYKTGLSTMMLSSDERTMH